MQFPKHTQCGFNLLGLYRSILSISLYYPILSRLFLVTFCIVFTANAQWQPVNGPYEATFFKISIDPQNPNVIYTAGESVYRSTNKGESWTNIEPNTLLSSNLEPVIKADPKNSGVVYFEGKGALFKSYDYGENWIIIGFEKKRVSTIEFDPLNSDVIYVGLNDSSRNAIWKSIDAGKTWQRKTNGIPESNFPFQNCKAIRINPLNPNSLIATIASFSGGVFRSIDGGNQWTLLASYKIDDIKILPWDTSTILIAGTSIVVGEGQGIFKSTDNGLNWMQIFNFGVTSIEIDTITRGFYTGGRFNLGVYKSTDEGTTWISLNNPNIPISFSEATNVNDVKLDPTDNNTLYIATVVGIYKSTDKGISWNQSCDGLNAFYAYDIKVAPSNPLILYAVGRDGIHKSNNGGNSWRYIGGAAAQDFIAVDPNNSEILYVSQLPQVLEHWLWRTTNGGELWEKKFIVAATFPFIEFDPINSNTVYTRYSDANIRVVSKSTNRGENWELLNSPEPTSLLISKENNLVMYIGSPVTSVSLCKK